MLLRTYAAVLADHSSQSIIEAAQRFTLGDVKDQSRTFAPSVAEFVQEVRLRQEMIDLKARPRIEPPKYRPGRQSPFEIAYQKKLSENSHLSVLLENIGYDEFRRLSRAGQIPVGAKWVAALGIVYGPEAERARHAA